MGLFTGTVENYRQYRSGIPPEVAALLVGETRPATPQRRLLDLGTGTGFVVEALKHEFSEIVGVDSDVDMLAAAEADVVAVPGQPIKWVQSTAESYVPQPGWAPDLVTVARAFHWFDHDVVLANLDGYVAESGTVAILGEHSGWTSDREWWVALRGLIQSFLGERRRAGDGFKQFDERSFPEILKQSPFCAVSEHTVTVTRERDSASVIGYLHSTSFAAARLFGDRLEEFDAAAREVASAYATDGVLIDESEFGVLLARRPS